MKKNLFFLFLILFISGTNAQISVNQHKVDRFFCEHFRQLSKITKHKIIKYKDKDIKFIYLITLLSGKGISIASYTGTPKRISRLELNVWKDWYCLKKSEIDWDRHIKKGLMLLKDGPPLGIDNLEKYMIELDNLKIE
jgi:hypothetical protein